MNKYLVVTIVLLCLSFSGSYSQSAFEHIKLADTLLWDDLYDEVAMHLAQADSLLAITPDEETSTYYQIVLGDYHLSQQQYPRAAEAYEPLLAVPAPRNKKDRLKLAKAINDLGIAYYHLAEMDKAKEMHLKSLILYDDDLEGLSYNYNNIALIEQQKRNPDSALYYYNKSLEASVAIPDSLGIAYKYLNIGSLYVGLGEDLKALDYMQKCRQVAEAIDNEKMVMSATIRLGVIYQRLRDLSTSGRYLHTARKYYETKDKPRTLGSVYKQIANLKLDLNSTDSARYYILLALEQYKPIESVHGIATSFKVLAKTYRLAGKPDLSRQYLDSAIALSAGKYRNTMVSSSLALADLLLEQGEYDKAIDIAETLNDKVEGNFPMSSQHLQARVLSQAYTQKGNYRKALMYSEKSRVVKDSVYNQERALDIARMEYQDETAREEVLRKANEERQELLLEQERERNRWFLITAMGIGILLVLLAFTAYRSANRKKRDNHLLSRQNETIAAKNNELESMNAAVAGKNDELQAKNSELIKLREKELRHQQYEKELMEETMAIKERELAAIAMVTHEKNSVLSQVEKQLAELQKGAGDLVPEVDRIRRSVASNLNMKDSWDSFVHQFETVHPRFFAELKERHPDLTLNDLKMSAYIKVGMGNKEIAQVTNLALSSVKKNINRLKKKLGLTPEESVRDYLIFRT
ncbi:MAG: tetratricopeptide repeat protein [Cyclobacteriaceae bacterium]